MSRRYSRRSAKVEVPVLDSATRSKLIWVSLAKDVVKARAGLIPSDQTDACPPPDGLSLAELRRWYRGLPVLVKSRPSRRS